MSEENTMGKDYVLIATRTRVSWREPFGNEMRVVGKRFKRGQTLEGAPDAQVARLVEMGHAVPKDEWDPAAFRKQSVARRLAMQSAAAADARSAVEAAAARGNGQPVAGLEDADAPEGSKDEAPKVPQSERVYSGHEVDGIKVEDVADMKDPDDDDEPEFETRDINNDVAPREDEEVPDFENMEYPELVQTAKAKTGNGSGTKEELKQRLRDHYDQ